MPTTTTAAQTESVSHDILRIVIPTLVLDGRSPADQFLHQHRQIVIQADTVQVRNRYSLPGRTVRILARRVEAENGVIDVSGVPVTHSYDTARVEPSLSGTQESPDGKAGADGDHGNEGGTIRIVAGEISGNLTLVANGSKGGNSQRGGDGMNEPIAKTGADGKFTGHEPPRGNNTKVLQPKGLRWYWEIAYGDGGGNALAGGDAGAPGRPGNGGAGGHIEVLHVAVPSLPPVLIANGEAPGERGVDAVPGRHGQPGLGGQNRLYQYHYVFPWSSSTWEAFAADGNSDVKEIVAKYGIAARCNSGAPTDKDGDIPKPVFETEAGGNGTTIARQVTMKDIAQECDVGYLTLVAQSAMADVAHGNIPRALQRLQWVAALTQTASDAERRALHGDVTEQIRTLMDQQVAEQPLADPAAVTTPEMSRVLSRLV